MPVPPSSTAELLNLIRKSGVASRDRLMAVSESELPSEPQKAAAALIQTGVITRFQAAQLLQGRHKGFRLGSHIVLDQLGRGGMGVVYLAEHQELRRKVAIKVLVVGREEDQKLAAERFLREARAAAALDHPNIVRIFDVCRHNEVPFLVMEYVEGETLQQTLDRDGPFPYQTAADIVAQVATGLQHAYEKGFVHRDIKPGNLMRDRFGMVKILDMGLARSEMSHEDRLTERLDAGAVVGTADYIAPEQALNAPRIDIRADIYSLGATFYALVSGKPPFEGNTTQKLLHHQLKSAPDLTLVDPTVPKELAAVVAKMLAKKAADRYQTPADAITALAPWLGNSARIVASLSQTNVVIGEELRNRLNEFAASRSGKLATGRIADVMGPDSGTVDPSRIVNETTPIAAAQTVRSPSRTAADPTSSIIPPSVAAPARGRNKKLLLAIVGGVIGLAVVAVVAVLALGGSSNPSGNAEKAPPADSGIAKTSVGVPEQPKPGAAATAAQPLYRLDLTRQKTFRKRGGHEQTGQSGRDVRFVQAEKTGEGDLPSGWSGAPYEKDAEAEYWAEPRGSRIVLGMRNLNKQSATLMSPDVEIPGARCRLRLEYMTDEAGDRVGMLKFKAIDRPARTGLVDLVALPGTNGAWQVVEVEANLRGVSKGFFEFQSLARDPAHGFYLAAFEVAEPPVGANGKPLPDPVAYQLDLAGQKPFAIRSGMEERPDGTAAYKLLSRTGVGEPPVGWQAGCQDVKSQMEFAAESTPQGPALVIRNVREPGSATLLTPKFTCQTGVCRLKLEYAATGREGSFVVRFQPGDKRPAWDVIHLPATDGAWRTQEQVVGLDWARGGAFEFHAADASPTAALRLRAVTVSELPAGTPSATSKVPVASAP